MKSNVLRFDYWFSFNYKRLRSILGWQLNEDVFHDTYLLLRKDLLFIDLPIIDFEPLFWGIYKRARLRKIHLGDVESSNILCEEIARRFNEFENWHECKDDTEAMPEIGTNCILRVEYQNLDDGEWYTDYLTSTWGEFGWAEDYLERITDIANEYRITHWKPINKPKGVEK